MLYGWQGAPARDDDRAVLEERGQLGLHRFMLFDELQSEPASEGLRRLIALVESRSLQPHIEIEASWTEIAAISQQLLNRSYVGKAVIHL